MYIISGFMKRIKVELSLLVGVNTAETGRDFVLSAFILGRAAVCPLSTFLVRLSECLRA